MRIANRNSFGQDNNKQSDIAKYAARQPIQQPVQEAEAYNRIGPNTPKQMRDLRKINKGIHGIITSVEEKRIVIRVIHSEIFGINDIVALDCNEYTRAIRLGTDIKPDMLMVGERVKAKYLNNEIDKLAYTIRNILSIEVY